MDIVYDLLSFIGAVVPEHEVLVDNLFFTANHIEHHEFTTRAGGGMMYNKKFYTINVDNTEITIKYTWVWDKKTTYDIAITKKGDKRVYNQCSKKLYKNVVHNYENGNFTNKKTLREFSELHFPRPKPPGKE